MFSNTFDVISVQLISVSRDWETVQNVFTVTSSWKPDRTDRDGKVAKQSKCSITLHIVGWVIIKPFLSGHSEIEKTKILMKNGRLKKAEVLQNAILKN